MANYKKNKNQPTNRQEKVLQAVVDEYTKTATPVSSMLIQEVYFPQVSPATIRNDMKSLETMLLLEKKHRSGGRVPTTKGYDFINHQFSDLDAIIDPAIKKRLHKIFMQRFVSIDKIIEDSIEIINQFTLLPAIMRDHKENELLKRIQLIETGPNNAVLIVVTSSGNVQNHPIVLNQLTKYTDLSICIDILDEYLLNTPMNELSNKIIGTADLLSKKVHAYEHYMNNIVLKIFKHYSMDNQDKNTSFGVRYLTSHQEFDNIDKMNEILNLIEDTSIWEQISINKKIDKVTTQITYGNQIGHNGIAIASTCIDLYNKNKEIAVIGPTRMDYKKIIALLEYIKKELEMIVYEQKNCDENH
ncbi:heat-inducible transcriptional repressor HrcA [Ureaplasma miroungigenitalium]|uniref:heat-inducible transcriptional repressor HrcA n=1 Tax=Ureaplasma miroungigenitalium TaxID=1042321 RepID=UPI0021E727E9|nr:heat-inducible transcriptional repressor HrcA [Ureaplasma miroungigenitalium]MCV3734023.1 heat-inducible transcriptional repressor HrcA [Ureaplasma miroungigenitalium]